MTARDVAGGRRAASPPQRHGGGAAGSPARPADDRLGPHRRGAGADRRVLVPHPEPGVPRARRDGRAGAGERRPARTAGPQALRGHAAGRVGVRRVARRRARRGPGAHPAAADDRLRRPSARRAASPRSSRPSGPCTPSGWSGTSPPSGCCGAASGVDRRGWRRWSSGCATSRRCSTGSTALPGILAPRLLTSHCGRSSVAPHRPARGAHMPTPLHHPPRRRGDDRLRRRGAVGADRAGSSGVYRAAMAVMLAALVPAVLVDWSTTEPRRGLVFAGLIGLAGVMVVRAELAVRRAPARTGGPTAAYLEHIGFTLISLADGFAVVAADPGRGARLGRRRARGRRRGRGPPDAAGREAPAGAPGARRAGTGRLILSGFGHAGRRPPGRGPAAWSGCARRGWPPSSR